MDSKWHREVRRIGPLLIIVLLVALTIMSWKFNLMLRHNIFEREDILGDFIQYWAAARLLLDGNNPYSPQQMLSLERQHGWSAETPLMMWNPPWVFPFLIPFGLLSYSISKAVWLLIGVIIVFLSTLYAWRYYEGQSQDRLIPVLFAFTFTPIMFALNAGQITLFLLIGLIGFLHFERHQKYAMAGVCTVFIPLKPHLLYLFWLFFFLWALREKHWKSIFASGVTILAALAVPLFFNLDLTAHYIYTASTEPPFYWKTPTIGGMLRFLFGEEKHWLQLAPSALGILGGLFYWQKRKQTWAWGDEMPLLLLFSLATASYGWSHDLGVSLLAVIQATVWVYYARLTWLFICFVLYFLTVNGIALGMSKLSFSQEWYAWMAPVLLVGYFLLRRQIASGRHFQ